MKKIVFFVALLLGLAFGTFLVSRDSDVVLAPTAEKTHAFQMFRKQAPDLAWPLENGETRERKLTFGMYVTPDPEENPIDPPERFTGYHTALDLEILPGEEEREVPVFAACAGEVLQAGEIPGYGGVLIQSCTLRGEPVTVLYGHLDFDRFRVRVGEHVETGAKIGRLGDHRSDETGDTRKHLHFGVHEGPDIEIRGYVRNESELEPFIDPLPLLTP